MAGRVGNQVDALGGMPGGKQLRHIGMRTLAHHADLVIKGRDNVFVRFDAQRRAFVDLPQGGGDGRGAQDCLAAGNQGEDSGTAAQDGLIRLELAGQFQGALFAVLLAMKSKGLPLSHRTKRPLHLGSAKSSRVSGSSCSFTNVVLYTMPNMPLR